MTNSSNDLPLSGYAVTGVFVIAQELKQVPDDAHLSQEDKMDITFSWDWRFTSEENDVFEVMLGVSTTGSQKRRYTAAVNMVGVFKRVGEVPSVVLQEFVSTQAIAILLPYARQQMATLTMAHVSGPFHLPTVNVMRLVKGFKPEEATGARQLAKREQDSQGTLIAGPAASSANDAGPPSSR